MELGPFVYFLHVIQLGQLTNTLGQFRFCFSCTMVFASSKKAVWFDPKEVWEIIKVYLYYFFMLYQKSSKLMDCCNYYSSASLSPLTNLTYIFINVTSLNFLKHSFIYSTINLMPTCAKCCMKPCGEEIALILPCLRECRIQWETSGTLHKWSHE